MTAWVRSPPDEVLAGHSRISDYWRRAWGWDSASGPWKLLAGHRRWRGLCVRLCAHRVRSLTEPAIASPAPKPRPFVPGNGRALAALIARLAQIAPLRAERNCSRRRTRTYTGHQLHANGSPQLSPLPDQWAFDCPPKHLWGHGHSRFDRR